VQMPHQRLQYFAQARVLGTADRFQDGVCDHGLIFYDHFKPTSCCDIIRPVPRVSTRPRRSASMFRGALRGGVVEHDQRIDRDTRFGVDQERVDVDRGDAGAGVRHQIGETYQRLHG
jgi:hypothetical protein